MRVNACARLCVCALYLCALYLCACVCVLSLCVCVFCVCLCFVCVYFVCVLCVGAWVCQCAFVVSARGDRHWQAVFSCDCQRIYHSYLYHV